MFNRDSGSFSTLRLLRRSWLPLTVAGFALLLLLAGQTAVAADERPQINQTVPPPTPEPPVPTPGGDASNNDKDSDDKDNNDNNSGNANDSQSAATAGVDAAVTVNASSVLVSDQESDGTNVMVDSVTAAVEGWMVIHADDNGKPGAVLGEKAVPAGTTANVVVLLDAALTGDTGLWAMLHIDAGEAGTYEFPGPDEPAMENGNIVMAPFAVTISGGAVAAATANATVEATVATPDATAEATMEATAVSAAATDNMEQTPVSLPATGGESSLPLLAVASAFALLVLGGAAFAFGRSS